MFLPICRCISHLSRYRHNSPGRTIKLLYSIFKSCKMYVVARNFRYCLRLTPCVSISLSICSQIACRLFSGFTQLTNRWKAEERLLLCDCVCFICESSSTSSSSVISIVPFSLQADTRGEMPLLWRREHSGVLWVSWSAPRLLYKISLLEVVSQFARDSLHSMLSVFFWTLL